MQKNNTKDDVDDDEAALSQLLAALAAGARAVQALPVGDEFGYSNSFPEFASALQSTHGTLLETLQSILDPLHANKDDDKDDEDRLHPVPNDVHDPLFWEECADACDALVEQVESFVLQSSSSAAASAAVSQVESSLQQWSQQARQQSQTALGRMVQGTQMDLPKPQQEYGMVIHCQTKSRSEPFVPAVHPDKPFHVVPLDLTFQPGSGLAEDSQSVSEYAPKYHVPHPYQTEIETLVYRDWQLQATIPKTTKPAASSSSDSALNLSSTWIDTLQDLQKLAQRLQHVQTVAVDLEAHSYRSFAGLVCLMQISVRSNDGVAGNIDKGNRDVSGIDSTDMENYLIDTLKLHRHINPCLSPMFANPDIVKVFHGADSDILWLQRDFGCYVVNLFDTGRAARALKFPSAGYAFVLHKYTGILADKSYQLADWRPRPLSAELQQYAIADTHYLLDIYERLKWDLQENPETSIRQVLDDSKKVSLARYPGEIFKPTGYKSLLGRNRRGRGHTELNATQEAVLKQLWDWRDLTARAQDESLPFVCTNANLLRMALAMPTTVTALQALFNPIPPLVMQFSQEILDRVKAMQADTNGQGDDGSDDDDEEDEEMTRQNQPVGTRSSAFFKPANKEKGSARLRDGIMSPVLGTEALYKQAGWMTPLEQVEGSVELATTSTEDDDIMTNDPQEKPERLLAIHVSNQDFRSKKYSDHSIEFGKVSGGVGRNADGMGAARAVRETSQSPAVHHASTSASVDDESRQAKQNAAMLQSGLSRKESIPVVLGMISPATDIDDDDEEEGGDDIENDTKDRDRAGEDTDEEFAIPRSMKEIYRISNRNRRNKKTGSPTPERGVTPTNERELEELRKAEALLKERGAVAAAYFDVNDGGSPEKRPRTRSSTGRESEESVPQEPSNEAQTEDDIAFMQEIGWIKSKMEGKEIIDQRYGKAKSAAGRCETEESRGEPSAMAKGINRHGGNYGFEYSTTGTVGVMPTTQPINPFFTDAAVTGGPLAQTFGKPEARQKKQGQGKGKQHRRQERPEKKDGRTHAYRKR